MANNLTFTIGSVFSGEGFKQARDSVGKLNSGLKGGMEAAEKLSGSLGAMDASASKAMVAMSGMINSLMTFNLTAIASQIAITGINLYVGKLKEEIADATKRSDELKASVSRAFSRTMSKQISEVQAEVSKISGDFDRVTKQAKAFADAMNGIRSANSTGGIINLEVEKLNAMIAANTEEHAKNIEAAYNLRIAKERAANSQSEWTDRIAESYAALETNTNLMTSLDDQLAVVVERRKQLEEHLSDVIETDAKKGSELSDTIAKLRAQEAAIIQKKTDAEAQTEILLLQRQKVEIDAQNAQKQATAAVLQAEMAQKKLTEEQSKRLDAEYKARMSALEKAEREKALKDAHAEAAKAQKSVNDSAKELNDAQREYAEALKKYEANWSDNKLFEALFGAAVDKMGKITINGGGKGLDAAMTEQAIKNAIANGDVRTVADLNKFARDAQRAARDQISKTRTQVGREKQRYEQLMDKNRKTWSKQDQDFVAKFEAIQKAAVAQQEELKKKEARLAEARKRDDDNHKNLEEINKKLSNLGLK